MQGYQNHFLPPKKKCAKKTKRFVLSDYFYFFTYFFRRGFVVCIFDAIKKIETII